MKKLKPFLLIIFLTIVLVYITNITQIPNSIILFKGENVNLGNIFGVNINKKTNNYEAIYTGVNINNNENRVEKTKISLELFNLIKVKDIDVNIIPKTTVIPLGECVGLKLYTNRSPCRWNDRDKWNKTIFVFWN